MSLYELHARPPLDRPVLVVGMEGWIDAGLGAATAMATLLGAVNTEPVATFDVDTLLDHRARRPIVRIVDGVNTGLRWPEIQLRGGHDADGHDLLLLLGPEPDHQWRAFTAAVGELATSFGVGLVIGLGAFPAPVPHTRPARLASTATTSELAHRVGFLPGALDEALNCLEKDHEFLLQGDVFTRDVISTWIWYKREKEVDAIRLRPHPYEFALYFDI